MARQQGHIVVDKAGLAQILEKRGKAFAIFELIQNAWDTDATRVWIRIDKIPGRPYAELVITDNNPSGFTDLSHAYTMFAPSEKKDDPTKRGRFNLGEKLVLALCKSASVRSTKGTVVFHDDGTRERTRVKTKVGSVFTAEIRMTRDEHAAAVRQLQRLIPPAHVEDTRVYVDGDDWPLIAPSKVGSFNTSLPTVVADDEGNLVRRTRKCRVDVYNTKGDEAAIYEMGIPVVTLEGGDKYHLDVQQKIPVNLDRDNVPPSYLRKLRVEVLNAMHEMLNDDDASQSWVVDAMEHKDVSGDAIETALDRRHGEDRVVRDLSDPEANSRAFGHGFSVIEGGSYSKGVWQNIRNHGAATPAGKLFPTAKPFSKDGDPAELIPRDKYTSGMLRIEKLVTDLGRELLDAHVTMTIVKCMSGGHAAAYGGQEITFSLQRLGRRWFNEWHGRMADVLNLIVHEYGHHYESDHLSDAYHRALTRLAGELAVLALEKPEIFEP